MSLGDRSELPEAIKAIIGAVRAEELDEAIEDVAEKSFAIIKMKKITDQNILFNKKRNIQEKIRST